MAALNLVLLVVRVLIIIYCVNKAKKLGISQWGWGIFAFFIPILALIIIQFQKPKTQVKPVSDSDILDDGDDDLV